MKTKNITLIIILLAIAAFIGVYLYFDKSVDDSDDSDDKDTDDGNTNTNNNTNTNIPSIEEIEEQEAAEHAEELADLYRNLITIGVPAVLLPNIANASNTR